VGNKKSIGNFIVIEGTDGSGKTTQVKLLTRYLKKEGFDVVVDDYPRYETSVWGQLIGRMLTGEFGDPSQINPYLSVLPYMLDEYFGSQDIARWLEKGRFVLSNRYFTSNIHQIGKLKGEARKVFRKWLWPTGWDSLGILKPDLIIVLSVDPKIAMKLIKKKGKRSYIKKGDSDLVEEDLNYQTEAAKEYFYMCQKNDNWVLVNCLDNDNKILNRGEICAKIIDVLKKRKFL